MNLRDDVLPGDLPAVWGRGRVRAAGRKYIERILVEQEHAKAGGERGVEGGQFMPSTGTGHAPATKSAGDATAIEPSDLPTADAPGPAVDPRLDERRIGRLPGAVSGRAAVGDPAVRVPCGPRRVPPR